MRRRARKTKSPWFWIEGLKKSGSGVKTWFPLYCSKDEAKAQGIEAMCRNKEVGFRDFRTVSEARQSVRCTCSSNYNKAIRKDGVRLWKCLNCGRTWEREAFTNPVKPSEPSTTPSKARNRPVGGADTRKRPANRQKKPERVVPVGKRRPRIK